MFTMSRKLYNALKEDLEEEVTDNYSGRFMFGKSCFGFTCNPGEFYSTLSYLRNEYQENGNEELMHEIDEFMQNATDMSMDSLGLGMIFYFENVQVEPEEEEEKNETTHSI